MPERTFKRLKHPSIKSNPYPPWNKNVARVSNLYRWKKQSSIPRYFVSNSLYVNNYQRKQSQNPQDFLIHDYFCFVLTSVVDFLHFEGLIVRQIAKIEFVLVWNPVSNPD